MDLKGALRPGHFDELHQLKRDQVFSEVPLWLWSPLVTRAEVEQISQAAEELSDRLLALGMNYRQREEEHLWLPDLPGLLESIRSDPADTDPTFHWRFDFLWDRERQSIHFLELNAGDPSGLGWVEAFTAAMRPHSLWQPHFQSGALSSFDLAGSHRRALEARLGRRPASVGFASARDSTVRSDVLCWAQTFEQAGYRVVVSDPLELEVRDDGLYRGAQRLEVLFRDTYEELYWPPYDSVGPSLRPLLEGNHLTLLNPLCATFWDSKALWAELPKSPTVPQTRRLTGPVAQRKDWVLKPSFDYGGRGVLCGSTCSQSTWDSAIEDAMRSPRDWVLQEAVPFSSELFPFLNSRQEIVWQERYLTWSAFLNDGKFAGLIARASSQPVVNVHNGGAIFPVYLDVSDT